MRNKAFTLVELLAVIVILAIILAIAIPSISSLIKNAQLNASISNEQMLLKAARTYIGVDDSYLPVNIGNTSEITLATLQTNNFISNIKAPEDKSKDCNGYVLITKTGNGVYDYTPYLNCISNVGNTLDDGLIGHWKLDNGQALDYTPNNHNGAIYNAVSASNRFNNSTKAINFDGVGTTSASRIDIGLIYERNPSYTLSTWAYRRSDRNFQFILGGRVGNNLSMGLIAADNRRLSFHTYDTADKDLAVSSSEAFKLNEWSHIAVTVHYTSVLGDVVAGTANLYVNGKLVSSNSFSNVTIYSRVASIGSPESNTYNRAFDGVIDDVRIYNRILSDAEIKYMYDTEMLKAK